MLPGEPDQLVRIEPMAVDGGDSAPAPGRLGRVIEKIEKNAISVRQAERPVITGDSVEFSTRSKTPISENDAFVALGGLQPKEAPL